MSRPHTLTPEQLALSDARKAKKQKNNQLSAKEDRDAGCVIVREWLQLQNEDGFSHRVKVMTWNLLAQCLVPLEGRELFPTSHCLKAAQRDPMLYREILSQEADIMCLQEVDRVGKLLQVLDSGGYSHLFVAGPKKQHGCLIAWREKMFDKIQEQVIQFDEQNIRLDGNERTRHGCSFRTKNIASLIALRNSEMGKRGFVVATTHLFWHPKYTYERARQAGILLREVIKFRADAGLHDWPVIIAGDFNFSPDDPAYSLLVGDSLLPMQVSRITPSRVVHRSVDPTVPATDRIQIEHEEEADPDKIITSARPAVASDGLLTDSELVLLFGKGAGLRSMYDQGLRMIRASRQDIGIFGDRVSLPESRCGRYEPEWTCYTHFWKTVLDYIFVVDPCDQISTVIGLSKPHQTKDLEPGLPQTNVCGSDHISLCAEIAWVEKA